MSEAWTTDLVLGCAVLLGASVQRLAGIGFARVAAPVLVLLLGPGDGVTLSNLAAGAISAAGLLGSWRQVRLTAMLPLVLAAACTVPAGAWVAARVPAPALLTGIGVLVTLASALVLRGVRAAALRGVGGAQGPLLWIRSDQRAALECVHRKAEEGVHAEHRQPTTTQRGACSGVARPA
ncbi:sulfite exporter TauE/SafE family protein [Streptomyces sp. CBMA156]|uniref:sulfite exporter TauE/SafE family protein n=1 Tax=Streptomyces sp. CBMA156 TaxID=1930280 RepID=UPI001661C036|nr:sulfite exporter TauE/SafE family protein [Streptomyces sp. CBMA156]MBD0676626.1 hypothetical protein [Streptomyces sp. CBMA156]